MRTHQTPQFRHASHVQEEDKQVLTTTALPRLSPSQFCGVSTLVSSSRGTLCPSPLHIPAAPTWKCLFYQRSQISYDVQNLFFSKILIGDVRGVISRKTKAAQSLSVTNVAYA